jgi:hypothetical protein
MRQIWRNSLPALLALCCVTSKAAEPVASRIEQARQFRATEAQRDVASRTARATAGNETGVQDESFGVQQILKPQEKLRPFEVFADVSGLYTNNVALTHRGGVSDAFLVATFGLSYERALTRELKAEITLGGGVYRYDKFSELDFESVDATARFTYELTSLADIELFAQYNFSDLISGSSGDEFFQGHTGTIGAQKTFALSRAHGIVTGVSAAFGKTDPSLAERDEYSVEAGYRLQATRHLLSDVTYRYSYHVYSEGGRRDHNNTVSLTLRYDLTSWLDIYGTAYFSSNSSNERDFSYDVFNSGGGLSASVKF